jgi:cystathionine beta-lyase/cystathionine gamma-synthase
MSEPTSKRSATLLCHDDEAYRENRGAVVPPIYQNSLFTFPNWEAIDQAFSQPADAAIYTRGNNPTVTMVEEKLAGIAGAERARLFASGMGAISSAILSCVNQGDHIVTIRNIYGPAQNFMRQYLGPKCGITTTFIEGTAIDQFEAVIQSNTKLIYLESPASLTYELQDLTAVARLARTHGIHTVIDNTLATPLHQSPLALGIDLEVHSASKYLGGHSDLVAGLLLGKKADLDTISLTEQAWLGSKMAPFEAWLLLRSLRTLPARLRLHQEQAMALALFLDQHPGVRKVYYTGLPSFPQRELADRQMRGHSGLLSIELATDDPAKVRTFVDALDLFKLGVSWGGHESLVYAPLISYLREMGEEAFRKSGIPAGLVRLSVGLEDVQDLQLDLDNALKKVR